MDLNIIWIIAVAMLGIAIIMYGLKKTSQSGGGQKGGDGLALISILANLVFFALVCYILYILISHK